MSVANDFSKRSDQWDIRINIPDRNFLEHYMVVLDEYVRGGSVRYLHVSGAEIGDVPGRSSYGQLHVHIALVLYNFTSKRSVVKKFTDDEAGWYVEARDKNRSIDGWINYHSKPRTKVDPSQTLIYVFGDLPKPRAKRKGTEMTPCELAKRQKKCEDWDRKKYLMKANDWDTLDVEFPGFIYSSMGQSMKREVMKQANDEWTKPLQGKLKNYIIWGPSGSGKSSSVALMYPNCYKKQKGSQYWDAYDKTNPDHSIVWIDEMSKETLKCMTGKQDGGFEFLKELADRYPVTVDEKYTKGYKIRPKTVIITMNEHPTSLLPDRAVEVNKQALFRKFRILHVEDWLVLNGLRNTTSGVEYIPISEFDLEYQQQNVLNSNQLTNHFENPLCSDQDQNIEGTVIGTGSRNVRGVEYEGYESFQPPQEDRSSLCGLVPGKKGYCGVL